MIERIFMRYGHAPWGIVGLTLKPETLKVWALSLHACSRLESALDEMTDEVTQSKVVTTHKEEAKAGSLKTREPEMESDKNSTLALIL